MFVFCLPCPCVYIYVCARRLLLSLCGFLRFCHREFVIFLSSPYVLYQFANSTYYNYIIRWYIFDINCSFSLDSLISYVNSASVKGFGNYLRVVAKVKVKVKLGGLWLSIWFLKRVLSLTLVYTGYFHSNKLRSFVLSPCMLSLTWWLVLKWMCTRFVKTGGEVALKPEAQVLNSRQPRLMLTSFLPSHWRRWMKTAAGSIFLFCVYEIKLN